MNHPVILFDGVFNLCNSSVQFVIKHDKKAVFHFTALQSEEGKKLIANFGKTSALDSILLVENGKIYSESTAALRIAKRLGFPVNWLYGLIIVPAFLRNQVYKFIARNRYKWFGKQESCMLPTPELKSRFLS
ncbi:MAG: thiol-disulfide oxidoreductase DCC family protein [Bacteroidia bacterium]|nr:thiol-disulfide oxidoreductase DCC family protein [Bacteroidia bacterium]